MCAKLYHAPQTWRRSSAMVRGDYATKSGTREWSTEEEESRRDMWFRVVERDDNTS